MAAPLLVEPGAAVGAEHVGCRPRAGGNLEDVAEQRRLLRAAGRLARARVTGPERADATAVVVRTLLDLPEVAAAERVLLTAAVGDELDLVDLRVALLASGTTVALPVTDGSDLLPVDWRDEVPLRPGWRDVPEPVGAPSDQRPDVVLVPALVLDRRGGRLGYGGGHFDRYLAGAGRGATTVGAVFHDQLVDEVPLLPHDVVLDVVVTERGVWRDSHGRG